MSYFPRAARLLVTLALATSAVAFPPAAVAADVSRSAGKARPDAPKQTREERRAQARAGAAAAAAAAAEAAKIRAARAHALAVAAVQQRLRHNKRLPKRASIIFDKNWKNPFDSRVVFRAWAKVGPKRHKRWVRIEQAVWRAGSGLGGRAGRDECRRNTGWLPNGGYSFVQHDRRKGPQINGRVFELQPRTCRNGTQRQLLFIHSEQTSSNTQCRNKLGDDLCRWEVPRFNDYRSNGCIKMAPDDLRNLTRRFHHYFRADVRYPTAVVKVRVKG